MLTGCGEKSTQTQSSIPISAPSATPAPDATAPAAAVASAPAEAELSDSSLYSSKASEEKVKNEILQDPRVQEAQKIFKAQVKIFIKE